MITESDILAFEFFVTYVVPIISVFVAAVGLAIARRERKQGSERMIEGLRTQFTIDRMLLKVLENTTPFMDSDFKRSLMGQLDIIKIALDAATI